MPHLHIHTHAHVHLKIRLFYSGTNEYENFSTVNFDLDAQQSMLIIISLSFVTNLNRIREVADKINKYGPQVPLALQSLKTPVKQIVIGPSHLGLLLEDGRALRVAFTVIPERLDLSKSEPSKG